MKTEKFKVIAEFKAKPWRDVLRWFYGHWGQTNPVEEGPGFEYIGRLDYDAVADFVVKALGRRLTQFEIAALEEGCRPQGLLSADDRYGVRLASPRYLGKSAPELEIYGTAVDGYADGEPLLKLAETVSLHYDDGVELIDTELVAAF